MEELVFSVINTGREPLSIGTSVVVIEEEQGVTRHDTCHVLLRLGDLVNVTVPTQGDRVVDLALSNVLPLGRRENDIRNINAIKLTFTYSDETIYLPYQDNMDMEGVEAPEELIEKWEKDKWGYTSKVSVEVGILQGLKDYGKISKCDEFGVYCFDEEMKEKEVYWRPYDGPTTNRYCSNFAMDCDMGEVYSKDFRFFTCSHCGRTICEQNPSNGWMTQYRMYPDEECGDQVCLSCFEKIKVGEGMTDEEIKNQTSSGMFICSSDMLQLGFREDDVIYGFHVTGKSSVDILYARAKELKSSGNIVFLAYDSMAIGGLEGYVTLWVKKSVESK